MKKPTFNPGHIVRVDFAPEAHTYGRMLSRKPNFAFYDFRTTDPASDLLEVVRAPILFIVAVSYTMHKPGRSWPDVGYVSLTEHPVEIPETYIQAWPGTDSFSILDNNGDSRRATLSEVQNLERAAVWDPHHVEGRLADHYAGRPNDMLERWRPRVD